MPGSGIDPNHEARVMACLGCGACPGPVAMANAATGHCPLGKFPPWRPVLLADAAPPRPSPPHKGCCDMDARKWGPPLWAEIHARPLLPLDREREMEFFKALPRRIPCCDCKAHLIAYVADHPIPVSDPDALRAWCVRLHDAVNVRLGKPLFVR